MKTRMTHVNDVLVGERLVGFVVLGILEEDLVHVGRSVLVKFVRRAEDDQRDLAIAQDAQLVSLFHDSELSFVERYLIKKMW